MVNLIFAFAVIDTLLITGCLLIGVANIIERTSNGEVSLRIKPFWTRAARNIALAHVAASVLAAALHVTGDINILLAVTIYIMTAGHLMANMMTNADHIAKWGARVFTEPKQPEERANS